jgi:hypothetical protein
MTNDTQLPAEVEQRIDKEAEIANRKNKDRVNSYRFGYVAGYNDGAAPYATKLHQAEQEIESLKQWKRESAALLNPILDYGQSKAAGIPLGKSITDTVLERCKSYKTARTLLEKFISRHEAGLLPDMTLYNEINSFLNGTK